MKRLGLLVVVLLMVGFLTACQVSAMSEGEMTLKEFLAWTLSPAAVGVILSALLEKSPFVKKYFDKITDPDWKRFAVLGACLAIPLLLGVGLASALGYTEFTAQNVFKALAVGWDAFATSTITHSVLRKIG